MRTLAQKIKRYSREHQVEEHELEADEDGHSARVYFDRPEYTVTITVCRLQDERPLKQICRHTWLPYCFCLLEEPKDGGTETFTVCGGAATPGRALKWGLEALAGIDGAHK